MDMHQTGAPGDEAVVDLSNLRFLVAEDDEFQREFITSLLRRLGALDVYGAHDGQSTLRALRDTTCPVDILVLDVAMPGMDGVEVIRTLGESKLAVAVILNSSFDAEFMETISFMAQEYNTNVIGAAAKPLSAAKLGPMVNQFQRNPPCRAQPEA